MSRKLFNGDFDCNCPHRFLQRRLMWMPAWNHLEPPGTPSEHSQRFDDVWSKLLDSLEANCAAAWSSRVCFFWSYFAVSHDVVDKSWQSHQIPRFKQIHFIWITGYHQCCAMRLCLTTACIHLACAGSSRRTLKKCLAFASIWFLELRFFHSSSLPFDLCFLFCLFLFCFFGSFWSALPLSVRCQFLSWQWSEAP